MQYLLLLYSAEGQWAQMSQAEQERAIAAYQAYTEALTKAGVLKGKNRLQESASATTVRVADGKSQVLDGPYVETKEQLGGYLSHRGARSRCRDLVGRSLSRRQPRQRRSASDLVLRMSEPAQPTGGDGQARGMADAVARRSYGKLVALLAARTGDLNGAEDALSEAFLSALENWPLKGCPSNPEAWLLSVARRKVIDLARRPPTSARLPSTRWIFARSGSTPRRPIRRFRTTVLP